MHMWRGPRFIRASRMITVVSALLMCRAWLYIQYFNLHGHTAVSKAALGIITVLTVGLLFAIKRAVHTQSFMTGGLYRLVAHPTYTMYILTDVWLWYLVPATPYSVITGILFYIVIIVTAYLEEISLIHGFGEVAKGYYKRTPSVHFLLWRLRPQ